MTCMVCDGEARQQMGGVLLCTLHAAAVRRQIDQLREAGERVDVSMIAYQMRDDESLPQFAPSAQAVLKYLRDNDITGGEAARMMYLSGGNQVRKYTGGAKPRQMGGARWFCLHAHHLLTPEKIAEIEAAMTESLKV